MVFDMCNIQSSHLEVSYLFSFFHLIKQEKQMLRNLVLRKTPYFNSPSVPSFRLLDDEDDLGNFVEDPKMRRPVGTLSAPPCPNDGLKSGIPHAVPNGMQREVILCVLFPGDCFFAEIKLVVSLFFLC